MYKCLSGVSGAPVIPGVYVYIDTVYPVMDNSPSDLQCVATDITDFTPTTLTWWRQGTTGGLVSVQEGSYAWTTLSQVMTRMWCFIVRPRHLTPAVVPAWNLLDSLWTSTVSV